MDWLNFNESAEEKLRRQAKRRTRVLMIVTMVWGLTLLFFMLGARYLSQTEQQPVIKQAENDSAQCLIQTLHALVSTPIPGIHLISISLSDKWEMTGISDNPKALESFKRVLSPYFRDAHWNGQFHMKGRLAC